MSKEFQYTFGLPRKVVWKYIRDEEVLRSAIPGCRSLVEKQKGIFKGEVEIKIGPLSDMFNLEVRLAKEKAYSYYYLVVKGKGNLGAAEGKASLHLDELQTNTQITIKTDIGVTGALSGPAQKMLNGGATKGIENFFRILEKEMKKKLYLSRKRRKV